MEFINNILKGRMLNYTEILSNPKKAIWVLGLSLIFAIVDYGNFLKTHYFQSAGFTFQQGLIFCNILAFFLLLFFLILRPKVRTMNSGLILELESTRLGNITNIVFILYFFTALLLIIIDLVVVLTELLELVFKVI